MKFISIYEFPNVITAVSFIRVYVKPVSEMIYQMYKNKQSNAGLQQKNLASNMIPVHSTINGRI